MKYLFIYLLLLSSVILSQNKILKNNSDEPLKITSKLFHDITNKKELQKILNSSFLSIESFNINDTSFIKKMKFISIINIPETTDEEVSVELENISYFFNCIKNKDSVKEIHYYNNLSLNFLILNKFRNIKILSMFSNNDTILNVTCFLKLKILNLYIGQSQGLKLNCINCESVDINISNIKDKNFSLNVPNIKKLSFWSPFESSHNSLSGDTEIPIINLVFENTMHLQKLNIDYYLNSIIKIKGVKLIDTVILKSEKKNILEKNISYFYSTFNTKHFSLFVKNNEFINEIKNYFSDKVGLDIKFN